MIAAHPIKAFISVSKIRRSMTIRADNNRSDNVDLMARMTTGRFRHLPVVQQGRLIGMFHREFAFRHFRSSFGHPAN
jgi:CBS domain-containing protein